VRLMCLLSELSASVEVHTLHGFSGLKVSTACGLSGCNTFSRNVVQLSTYTMAKRLGDDGKGCTRRLAQPTATLLFRFPWFCINRLVNVFAYAGTMEYSRGRRTLGRTKRVDLDVNYRSLGPDVPRGG